MIDDGIKRVIYEVRIDYTLQDFKRLQRDSNPQPFSS